LEIDLTGALAAALLEVQRPSLDNAVLQLEIDLTEALAAALPEVQRPNKDNAVLQLDGVQNLNLLDYIIR
jgi:hypothetical protein